MLVTILLGLTGVSPKPMPTAPPVVLCRLCTCIPASDGKVGVCPGVGLHLVDAAGQSATTTVDPSSTETVIFNNVHATPSSGKTWGDVYAGGCGNLDLDC